MTRPLDKHLDDDELNELISSASPGASDAGRCSSEDLEGIREHLVDCEDCVMKVRMHDRAQNEIRSMSISRQSASRSGCPMDEGWIKIAGGVLPEAKTKQCIAHAAECEHCGPLLKSAMEILASEASPEEEEFLRRLESSHAGWRRNMTMALTNANSTKQPSRSLLPGLDWFYTPRRLGYALYGIAALIAISWPSCGGSRGYSDSSESEKRWCLG